MLRHGVFLALAALLLVGAACSDSGTDQRLDEVEARLGTLEDQADAEAPEQFTVVGTYEEMFGNSESGQFCVEYTAFGGHHRTCVLFTANLTRDADRCRADVQFGQALPQFCR